MKKKKKKEKIKKKRQEERYIECISSHDDVGVGVGAGGLGRREEGLRNI